MDIERLNKTQIILLTLLVSFVTSIATGIATVSLMEEAPTDVTRVISRIVEKPIETVIPGEREVITQERTVVVSESEGIAAAVATIAPSVVRMYTATRAGEPEAFIGFGVIVAPAGVIVADARIVDDRERYVARLADGTLVAAEPSTVDAERGFFALAPKSDQTLPTLVPATFASYSSLALGDTVIALGGDAATRIAPGVITELMPAANASAAPRVRTTVDGSLVALGTPLVTLDGAVIGMPESAGGQVFVSLGE